MLGLPGNLSRTMPANTGVAGLLPPGMPGATNVPAGAVFPHASAWRNRVRKLKRERSAQRVTDAVDNPPPGFGASDGGMHFGMPERRPSLNATERR